MASGLTEIFLIQKMWKKWDGEVQIRDSFFWVCQLPLKSLAIRSIGQPAKAKGLGRVMMRGHTYKNGNKNFGLTS